MGKKYVYIYIWFERVGVDDVAVGRRRGGGGGCEVDSGTPSSAVCLLMLPFNGWRPSKSSKVNEKIKVTTSSQQLQHQQSKQYIEKYIHINILVRFHRNPMQTAACQGQSEKTPESRCSGETAQRGGGVIRPVWQKHTRKDNNLKIYIDIKDSWNKNESFWDGFWV